MDPTISFCRTPNGAQIAYTTLGHGPFLIVTPASLDTIELRFKLSDDHYWQALASHFTVVSYDRCGTGLSDFSPAADAVEILALADALQADQFDLLASFQLTPAAAQIATDQPQRLRRLALYSSFARGEALAPPEIRQSLIQMARGSLRIALRTLVDLTVPNTPRETLDAIVEIGRAALDGETMARFLEATYDADLTDLLPRITTPTLVLHRQGDLVANWHQGREVSAAIPDARLTALPGEIHWPWMEDVDQILDALFDFLAPGTPVPARDPDPTPAPPREPVAATTNLQLRTVLFTDVEASTQLTDRFGDERARDILRRHEQLTRQALNEHGGTEVKTMGDGFMAAFSSVSQALNAAIAMQRGISAAFDDSETPLKIRIGVNAGEPIAEDDDLYGTAVIQAARAMAEAAGGEILCTNVVRELARGRSYLFADRGAVPLRGFDEPVRLYELSWRQES